MNMRIPSVWRGLLFLSLFALANSVAHAAERPLAPNKSFLVAGFSQANLSNERDRLQANQLQRALAKVPRIKMSVSDAKGSSAQQIRDIEDFVDSRADILVVNPLDVQACAPALARARKQGIPVVMLARGLDEKAFTTLIVPDDTAIGREAARHLAVSLKQKGRIAILQEESVSAAVRLRMEAFMREAARYPKLKLINVKAGNGRADAIRAVEEALRQGVQFDALFAVNDALASSARLALKGAGLDPKRVPMVGVGYLRESREALLRKEQSASFTYPIGTKEIADTVARIAAGKPVPKRIIVSSAKVTAAEAERISPLY